MPVLIPVAAAVFGAVGAAATIATALGAATIFGVSVGVLSAVATVGMLATAAVAYFTAPKVPKPGSQENPGHQIALKVATALGAVPITYGRTATSGFVTYEEPWGAKNRYLTRTHVLSAGGPIQAIEKYWADDYEVNLNGDPLTGLRTCTSITPSEADSKMFKNKLQAVYSLGARPDALTQTARSGLALPDSPGKLSGLAYAMTNFDYDQEAWPSGSNVESKWVLRGVKVYDPRKDSTHPGGSGAHRLHQPDTYEWSENPFLCALDWVLGRYENDVKVYGIGADPNHVDLTAFVTGANVCDANAWKIGGVVETTDDKMAVLTTMLQAGGGSPIVSAGFISAYVNAPKTAIYTIEPEDVIGSLEILNSTPWRDRKNTIVPSYREETQFWKVIPGNAVSGASYVAEDGGTKTTEVSFAMVQSAEQAHQLAAYEMVNTREFLTFALSAGPRLLLARVGDAVNVNLPEIGATTQKCIVVAREFDPSNMMVKLRLRSETDEKHDFALGRTDVAPPSPGLDRYDPTNPPAPGPTAWTATGTAFTQGGVSIPAIVVEGENDDPNTATIAVDYRVAGSTAWNPGASGPKTTTRFEITSVTPGTPYDVSVSYRTVRGVQSARRILGPVTCGDFVIPGEDPGPVDWDDVINRPVTNTGTLDANQMFWEYGGGQSIEAALTGLDIARAQLSQADSNLANAVAQTSSDLANAAGAFDVRIDEIDRQIALTNPDAGTLGARFLSAEVNASGAVSRVAGMESVSLFALNLNPAFAGYATASGVPNGWIDWFNGGLVTRTTGMTSPYAASIVGPANDNGGLFATGSGLYSIRQGQWLVLEAVVTLAAGTFAGAGLWFQLFSGQNYSGEGYTLVFATDKDNGGNVIGAGTVGQTYHFSRVIKINTAGTTQSGFFAMSHWDSLGSISTANNIIWHKALVRPASRAEQEIGLATAGGQTLQARLVNAESAYTDGRFANATTVSNLSSELTDARQGNSTLLANLGQIRQTSIDGLAGKASASEFSTLKAEIENARGGNVSLSANILRLDQAIVNGDTAIAQRATQLEAVSHAPGAINTNPVMAIYDPTYSAPLGLSLLTTGSSALWGFATTSPGLFSNYKFQTICHAGGELGFNWTVAGGYRALTPPGDWFVIQADFLLNGGNFSGAGMYLEIVDPAYTHVRGYALVPFTEYFGEVGTAGRRYTMSAVVRVVGAVAGSAYNLFAWTKWGGFGQSMSQTAEIWWDRVSVRPATQQEIEVGQVGPDLKGQITTLQNVTTNGSLVSATTLTNTLVNYNSVANAVQMTGRIGNLETVTTNGSLVSVGTFNTLQGAIFNTANTSSVFGRIDNLSNVIVTANSATSSRITNLSTDFNTNSTQLAGRITAYDTAFASGTYATTSSVNTQISGIRTHINNNGNFNVYTTTTGIPTGWDNWLNGASASRVNGLSGQWGYRQATAGLNHGIVSHGAPSPGMYSIGPGFYVLEATITLNDGVLNGGSGVHYTYHPDSSYTTYLGNFSLNFASDPDITGNVVGAGTPGRTYRFSKLVNIATASARVGLLYLMTNWDGLGGNFNAFRDITWHECGIRPATADEVTNNYPGTGTRALVSTQQGTLSTLQGRTSAYYTITAAAGAEPAHVRLNADGYGSEIALAARKLLLLNTSNNTTVKALELINGFAYFGQPVSADYNGYRVTIGPAFGPSADVVFWYGSNSIPISSCTRTNGYFALGTDGAVYKGTQTLANVRKEVTHRSFPPGHAQAGQPFGYPITSGWDNSLGAWISVAAHTAHLNDQTSISVPYAFYSQANGLSSAGIIYAMFYQVSNGSVIQPIPETNASYGPVLASVEYVWLGSMAVPVNSSGNYPDPPPSSTPPNGTRSRTGQQMNTVEP